MSAEKLFKVGFILSATDKMSRVIDQAVGKSMKSLSGFESNASKAGKSVMKSGTVMTAAGAAVGAAALGIAKSSADYAGSVKDMSEATGIDTENWQKMTYAAKIAGIEKEKLMTSMVKFDKTIAEAANGSKKAAGLFKDFGISIKDAAGNVRAPEEIFKDVVGVFGNLEDSAVKTAAATDFFGKSGAELMPLLNEGKEGLEKLYKAAEESGNVLGKDALEAADKFGKKLDITGKQVNGLKLHIGSALVPMLDGLLTKVMGIIGKVKDWTDRNPKLVQTIGKIALGLSAFLVVGGSAALVIGSIIFITGKFAAVFDGAIKAVRLGRKAFIAAKNSMLLFRVQYAALVVWQKISAAAQWLVNKAMLAFPVIAIIAGIAAVVAGVALLVKNWDKVSAFFVRLWAKIKDIFSKAWEGIKAVFLNYTPAGLVIKHWDKITGFFGRLWDGVKSGISKGWDAIKTLFFNYTPLGILLNHWQNLPQMFSALWNKVKEVTIHVWDSIGEFFSGLGKRFFEWGKNLIMSLWNGIKSVVNNVIEKIKNVGRKIANGFKSVLGINSPSKVFMEYGLNITQGLTDGMDSGTPDVEKSAGGVASRILEGAAQSDVSSSVYNSYAAGGGSVNLNYSPNITINGNMTAEEKQDFAKMLRDNADEIMQMFEQWQRNKVRLSFLQ